MPDSTKLEEGMMMVLMIMLSSQEDFTFVISRELMQCFPFHDFIIDASSNGMETVVQLKRIGEKAH